MELHTFKFSRLTSGARENVTNMHFLTYLLLFPSQTRTFLLHLAYINLGQAGFKVVVSVYITTAVSARRRRRR